MGGVAPHPESPPDPRDSRPGHPRRLGHRTRRPVRITRRRPLVQRPGDQGFDLLVRDLRRRPRMGRSTRPSSRVRNKPGPPLATCAFDRPSAHASTIRSSVAKASTMGVGQRGALGRGPWLVMFAGHRRGSVSSRGRAVDRGCPRGCTVAARRAVRTSPMCRAGPPRHGGRRSSAGHPAVPRPETSHRSRSWLFLGKPLPAASKPASNGFLTPVERACSCRSYP